jgi:hypothetical protein
MTRRGYAGQTRCNKIYPKRSTKKVTSLKMDRRQARLLAANLNRAVRNGWNTIEINAHRKRLKDGTFHVTVLGPLTTVD